MSLEEFAAAAEQHLAWTVDYFRRVRDLPVLPRTKPGDLLAALPRTGPERGESMETIFRDFQEKIFPGLTLWNHPRFFGYFANSSVPPAILAELLAATVNVNVMLWRTSPAATELEQVTLGWLRDWLGLPQDWFGIIHDTASTAVMHAMIAAREWADPEARTRGMRKPLTVYISEQTHSSSEKAALLLGFGQDNVRKIPVDAEFRMRADALVPQIERDIAAGFKPCCIVASIGSTSTSAIDAVPAIADVAEKHGIWLHVDAAYGGSAAIVPEMRHVLDGAERAHSFVVNPHKWLYVPVDCSVFYTRHPEMLRRACSLQPEYLKTAEDDQVINYNEYGMPLGRRFRALKLWYVLRYYGRDGITAMLRESLQLTQKLKGWVENSPDFELCAPVPFSLVCFRHRSSDENNRKLLDAVNATGKALLSHTVLNGRFVLRFALGNFLTTEADVRETWELIRGLAGA